MDPEEQVVPPVEENEIDPPAPDEVEDDEPLDFPGPRTGDDPNP
jgi:hypothetical protein